MSYQDEELPENFGLDADESLRLDNQIKRLELEMKGAKFIEHNPDGIQLPPELESQMLNSILAFESIKNDAKEIAIYDFVGKPTYLPINSLDDADLILALERILHKMHKKGIILNTLSQVDDREFYRFITEEFFQKTILNIPVKGFMRQFFYEDFYPNDLFNIGKLVELFLQILQEDDQSPFDILLRDEALKQIHDYTSFYSSYEVVSHGEVNIYLQKIQATVTLPIELKATLDNSSKSHLFSGEMKLTIRKRKGLWQIKHIHWPPTT